MGERNGDFAARRSSDHGGLRTLNLSPEYRRGHRDLVTEFYVPCLRRSRTYLRAAGYFTSSSLAIVAAGLPTFIQRGGSSRLLASPFLEEEDVRALERGVEARGNVVQRALLRSFDEPTDSDIVADRLGFLAWLVASGRLDIRIALPSDSGGLYHEKYGLFIDEMDDAVAFTGSPNETRGGLESNFESIDVFQSWTSEGFRVDLKREAFEAAWDNRLAGLETVPLPEAVSRRLLQFRPDREPDRDPFDFGAPSEETAAPPKVEIRSGGPVPRDYQLEAIRAWFRAGQRGVLEMATGTGKTITALLAVDEWASRASPSMVVVAAPFKHLVDQWVDVMRGVGLTPVVCYDDSAAWGRELDRLSSDLRIGLRPTGSCVMTHEALRSPRFAAWVAGLPDTIRTVIVGDEVHNLGSASAMDAMLHLPFGARLGLSATPRRWSDTETAAIFEYFGEPVYEFPLERAIREGFLVPYEYHPHVVELSEDEFSKYVEVSRKLARLGPVSESVSVSDKSLEDVRGALLRLRSGILNNAASKLGVLANVLGADRLRYALVYTTSDLLTDTVRAASNEGRRLVHRFTYRETMPERRRLLTSFADGDIDILVAIKCLDEGVDIPRTERAFILASSSNSREFIQRRGRILRRAEGKERAVIHDFLAIPPRGVTDEGSWAFERMIVRRELKRFDEFAQLATNRYEAELGLMPIRRRYQIFDA